MNEHPRPRLTTLTTRYTTTTAEFGYRVSSNYSDVISAGDLETAVINRIVVRYNNYITSLTVHYVGSTNPAIQRGGNGNLSYDAAGSAGSGHYINEVALETDEWITKIEGTYLPKLMSSIKFVSNTGRTWGPFGYGWGTKFVLDAGNEVPLHLASRMGLIYFEGNCGNYIYLLKATFAEYGRPEKRTRSLNFESRTGLQSTGVISPFARHLMSPVITLRIGRDMTEFHVYEVILCRLPFFRAVLQGELNRASGEAIPMHDDRPDTIGALIEFLYTGTYTYSFDPYATPNAADIPIGDISRASFHIAVYAVACKCECAALVQGALKNFGTVLKRLRGLDVIEVWKVAYQKGLYLSQIEADDDLGSFMDGLPKLVGGLYRTNRKEMEVLVLEYPKLASELLRLVSTGHGI